MKKLLLLALALLLVCPCALAQSPLSLDLGQVHAYEYASSLCYVGDTLYMLGSYGIYAWQDGALDTVVDLSDANPWRYNPYRPEEKADAAAWEKAVSLLLSDGEMLCALHPYSGEIFRVQSGVLLPWAQLPEGLLGDGSGDFVREIRGAAFSGSTLMLLLGPDEDEEYDQTSLYACDLQANAAVPCAPQRVTAVAGGPEGKLLLCMRTEEESYDVCLYDIASDTVERVLAETDAGCEPGALAWHDGEALYCADSRVYAASGEGPALVKAYLPVIYTAASTQAACSPSGLYAYPCESTVLLRETGFEGECKQTVLTLMGGVSQTLLMQYALERPDVAIVSVDTLNLNGIKQAALSGDTQTDLFMLSAPGAFAYMRDKGYLKPLTDGALLEDAGTLYPAVRETVMQGDALFGYPLEMDVKCWTVNQTQWQRLELGDYPSTYAEMFDAMANWRDARAEDEPDYTLSDFTQIGISDVVLTMTDGYIARRDASSLSFDTPVYRELLALVCEHAGLLEDEQAQWCMPLLCAYSMGFGCTYADTDLMRMLPPPQEQAGEEPVLPASLRLLCVSAASAHAEEAANFIAFCAAHQSDSLRYALHPGLNEPVESDFYEARMAELTAQLDDCRARLAGAEEDELESLQETVASLEGTIERVQESRWAISPESIAVYRETAKYLRIPADNPLLIDGEGGGHDAIREVIARFCEDGLAAEEIDALALELDRVAQMALAEGL